MVSRILTCRTLRKADPPKKFLVLELMASKHLKNKPQQHLLLSRYRILSYYLSIFVLSTRKEDLSLHEPLKYLDSRVKEMF